MANDQEDFDKVVNEKKRARVDPRLTMLALLAPLEQEDHCLLFGIASPQGASTLSPSLVGSLFTFAEKTNTPRKNTKHNFNLTEITPRQLSTLLNQGHFVFFLAHTRPATRWLRSELPSRREVLQLIDRLKLTIIQESCLAPHLDDVRWVFPCSRVVASSMMELYQPSLLAGKGRKVLYRALSLVNMTNLWAPYRILTAARAGSHTLKTTLPLLIAHILNRQDIQLGFFTGTPSYYHKVTAQVISNSGEVIAYGKIASTDQAASMLAQEAQNLTFVDSCGIESFVMPRLLWIGKLYGYSILLQSAPQRSDPGPVHLTEKHISALAELHRKTEKPLLLENGEFFKELKRRIDWLETRVNDSLNSIFKAALARVLSHIGHTDITHGVCHRDFTPWNTKVVDDTLYVFDWEWSLLEAPPFIDLFHFLVSEYTFVNQYDAVQIMERLFHWDTSFIIRYAKMIGIDGTDLWPSYLILYLLDLLTFYAEADILEGKIDSFSNREFSIRFDLLKLLEKDFCS
jgi:hypothetical protein